MKEEKITIKKQSRQFIQLRIVGDTPLITHAWSEKAKRMMLEKQTKATKTSAKEIRDPFAEFMDSMYWMTERPKTSTEAAFRKAIEKGAKFGFPVTSIKQAGNSAAYRNGWVKNQMQLRGSYFLSNLEDRGDLAQIVCDDIVNREDMVRIGMGTADLRYRAQFNNWHMNLLLEYMDGVDLTLDQIINVIDAGGASVGIGEWRPERDGDFGRYHVDPSFSKVINM